MYKYFIDKKRINFIFIIYVLAIILLSIRLPTKLNSKGVILATIYIPDWNIINNIINNKTLLSLYFIIKHQSYYIIQLPVILYITEAITLSDRIVTLTKRPGTIKNIYLTNFTETIPSKKRKTKYFDKLYEGFFLNGELVEFDETKTIFTNPSDKRTEDYITGRFG